MAEQALPGKMLLAELSRKTEPYGRSNSRSISREHLESLITAARLALALRDEVMAWRRKVGNHGGVTGTWYSNGSWFRVPIPEADCTDALCAKLGVRLEER